MEPQIIINPEELMVKNNMSNLALDMSNNGSVINMPNTNNTKRENNDGNNSNNTANPNNIVLVVRGGTNEPLLDTNHILNELKHLNTSETVTVAAVDHPNHYNKGSIEVIAAIEEWKLNFHLGNAIKYIARAGHKDPAKTVEDLEKAIWYINRQIDRLKGESTNAKTKV